MDNRLTELDFETLEKISKSVAMIDEQFDGNLAMKRAVFKKYGLSLDDFPTMLVPSPVVKETQEKILERKKEPPQQAQTSLEIQNKLVYGDKWYVLQNRLLNAITDLDLNERRLIMFLSPMVRKDVESYPDKGRRFFVVQSLDFAEKYGMDSSNAYKMLAKSASGIINKSFYFWNFKENSRIKPKNKVGSNWVDYCEYKDREGCIEISLTTHVIEMLTVFDKANPFTKYQIDAIVKLGCYGIILFELISSCLHQNFKQKTYTIEFLKEKFNCVEKYNSPYEFKRNVIDRAIKEIHKHTSIRVSYEQKKIGRMVSELLFSFEDTAQKKTEVIKEQEIYALKNPFINFKMTQKQLSLFASKIKKASGQDVEEIIAELSNVHLQSKHIDFLKVLDYVPSDWYSDDEIKSHLTAEQIAQVQAGKKAQAKVQEQQRQEQFRADMNKLVAHAETFVKANLNKVAKTGIERIYLQQENYAGIVRAWERHLLDEKTRKHFAMLDEILAV